MPFLFDETDNSISMASGDTGELTINIDWDRLTPGDIILFAVFDQKKVGDLVCKYVEIENGEAIVRLCNHDTRDIPPGRYKWNLRIVTSPAYDVDGSVRVDDCSDDVITVYDEPPSFRIIRGGAYV